MMFFKSNHDNNESPLPEELGLAGNKLFKFFHDSQPEEITRLVDEISPEAHQLFENSLKAMLGYMPEGIATATYTINKDSLKQLLFSATITGYLTKCIENKLSLEKYWQDDAEETELNNREIEKQLGVSDFDFDSNGGDEPLDHVL